MDAFRIEKDSMGEVKVPNDKYWGAQTERSYENFKIGIEKMPVEIVRAFALLKGACAQANQAFGKLDAKRADAIEEACDEALAGKLDGNFPLAVWQTGSGTQSNMNMNEVFANRAIEILGGNFRDKASLSKDLLVHPNDHVNMSQSSNDTFPSALSIMSVIETTNYLLPRLEGLEKALYAKSEEFKDLIKSGRTHLQDATPLTLGQEFSGYASMLTHSREAINAALEPCRELAIGGTAVGTGINSPEGFGAKVAEILTQKTGVRFKDAPNKFHALTSHDAVCLLEGALAGLAADLMKIANDIRWLASGPRCGLGEINIPANEPGSSIMPGKVNPTQCEAVTMVAVQVMANATAINFAASQGNFELNVFKPVIAYNLIQSIKNLADVMKSFEIHCVTGITANKERLHELMTRSLMLVTALSPLVGYMNAAKIAHYAHVNNKTLKEAALELKMCTEAEFDQYVEPTKMIHPNPVKKCGCGCGCTK
ncbi:class II fumarate hydratase [uncultured Sutterella sp.]|uniref:class II fumarate hydratase n=1 Tax=uncultured Sutterella sp. TaxID=286133 RepID=UPI0026003924|nr:class II fumarate hydratase [uncultured Sutterella sp.]